MKKRVLALVLVLAMLVGVLPAGALAAEAYTDVGLSFRDASNGFIFDVQTTANLKTQYGTWKNLYLTAQCWYSNASGENAFSAEPVAIQVRFNVDDDGRLRLYDAKESQGVKLVIPAGTVATPADAALSNVKLRITNEIVLEREPSYWGSKAGWLAQAEQSEPKSIKLGFSRTDDSSNWIFTHNILGLKKGWYRTNAIVDGVETQVMMEYTGIRLYIYAHTFRTDKQGEIKTPYNSFVIPQGANLIPVTSFEQSSMVTDAQPYEVTTQLQVVNIDGKWTVGERYQVTALTCEQDKITGQYTTVSAAVKAAQGTNQYVKLVADSQETVFVSRDLYLDLSGYDLAGVAVANGATLYAMDTATDSYDSSVGYGSIGAITGSYAPTHRTNADGTYKRYLAVAGEEGISFHRFYVGITQMNLRTDCAGVGYTLTVAGDAQVLAAMDGTEAFGFTISVKDENGNAIEGAYQTLNGTADQLAQGINTKSLLIRNILSAGSANNEKYGQYTVCVEAFVGFDTGKVSASVTERSMQQILERADTYFADYSDSQKNSLKGMYTKYNIGSLGWAVEQIAAWTGDSGVWFLNKGTCDYQIVKPDNADDNEAMAAAELQNFIKRGSGLTLQIISESQAQKPGKYFYIGATRAADQAGVKPTYEQVGYNGFRMVLIDDDLYLRGWDSIGTRNSVYEFLQYLFDYDYYSIDELYVKTLTHAKMPAFDLLVKPSFEWRIANYGWAVRDDYTRARMRMNHGDEVFVNGWDCHYSYDIVSPVEYDYTSNQYKDWFAPRIVGPEGGPYEPVQLCHSNEEMTATYIENLLKILENYDQPVIILGQEDHPWWCECATCKQWEAKYGTDAAVMIVFLNKVQAAVDAWFAENRPGEQPTMCLMFAYYDTVMPPAQWNAQSGKWEPMDETVVLNPNSGILFAPIDMECDVAFSDYDPSDISNPYGQLMGWKALTGNIYGWNYSQIFSQLFLPYNTFDTVQQNYQLLINNGCVSMLDQTNNKTAGFCSGWNMAKSYVLSKLQWDNSLDTEELLDKFFNRYYDGASKVMYSLFRDEMDWLNHVYAQLGAEGGIYEDMLQEQYWPQDLLQSYLDRIDMAYAAIAPMEQTDPDRYALVHNRINLESLQFRYLMLQLYPEAYDAQTLYQEKLSFRADCEHMSIELYGWTENVTELWEAWGIA